MSERDLIDSAIKLCGGKRADWHMVGQAAVHRDAVVHAGASFVGPAIVHNGEYRGGWYRGGVFRGGEYRGGWFYGGVFHGGTYTRTPLQVFGLCVWPIVVQGNGDDRIAVGCECHSLDDWMAHGPEIARKHATDWEPVRGALEVVAGMIRQEQTP